MKFAKTQVLGSTLFLFFQCTICQKKFTRGFVLLRHMRTHGEGLFKCKYCLKSFDRWVPYQSRIFSVIYLADLYLVARKGSKFWEIRKPEKVIQALITVGAISIAATFQKYGDFKNSWYHSQN
jgi:hypothetical protein